jgi:hypothetical protein
LVDRPPYSVAARALKIVPKIGDVHAWRPSTPRPKDYRVVLGARVHKDGIWTLCQSPFNRTVKWVSK